MEQIMKKNEPRYSPGRLRDSLLPPQKKNKQTKQAEYLRWNLG
jgi:hypothetical protein